MKEFSRQVMQTGRGTQFPHVKAAAADLADKHGRGGIWFMPANPEIGIPKDSINYPILAQVIIEKRGLIKTATGITDADGKRVSRDDLYKMLREEISLGFPEAPEKARQAFPVLLDAIPQAAVEPGADCVGDYLLKQMGEEMQTFQAGASKKTGFPLLDAAIGGLYPGLYIVAATTGLGKTTIIHQIADQLAAAGNHVLYFSLEMSRLELVSKSLSRTMAKLDKSQAASSLAIRLGRGGDLMPLAIKEYAEAVGNRLSIIEGNFNRNVPYIAEYVQSYIEKTGERPVVFVDYLQIMQPPADMQRSQLRENIDLNITELKRLSRAFNIPVCVVSSISRTYYLQPISLESLKESGGLEYSADCVWGLQFSCMNEELFKKKDTTWAQKDEQYKKARNAIPRKIDLVVLKSRFTGTDIIDHFDYFPAFDYFKETEINAKDARSGMQQVNVDLPFENNNATTYKEWRKNHKR